MAPATTSAAIPRHIGGYTILRQLGQGGMTAKRVAVAARGEIFSIPAKDRPDRPESPDRSVAGVRPEDH